GKRRIRRAFALRCGVELRGAHPHLLYALVALARTAAAPEAPDAPARSLLRCQAARAVAAPECVHAGGPRDGRASDPRREESPAVAHLAVCGGAGERPRARN